MNPAIEIKKVNFAYGSRPALKDFSLEIAPGERVAVLGPNGSGKSTLLKILSRTLEPEGGEVILFGKPIQEYDRRSLCQQVAVVPQETHLSFPYTVTEVVLMGRASFQRPFGLETRRDLEVARATMELTDTWSIADRYLHELSSGERQRVILARALAQEAAILLLDEPTTFLDIKHQIQIHELVQQLSRQRRLTVIAALHDLNLASLYCPRLVLLSQGTRYASGAPKEILTEETIYQVYGARVRVERGITEDKPQILPLPLAHDL
jgi:iron complex transport system ATP-binding protein